MTPSVGSSLKPEISLFRADFGDGYSQAAPRGLNHIRRVASLRWDVLTRAEKNAIEAHFVERGGNKSFRYTVPGDTSERRYTCDDWNITTIGGSLFAIEATFREAHHA